MKTTNKLFLYFTEFFSGMGVMAVELGASRLLAPYFSSSQIVWTIIIGTIMIAMALGNLWGGKRADRQDGPDALYTRILIAALWIAAIPVLGKYLILAISGLLVVTISTNFLVIAAFISCMLIFVFPLFLLGTVTPSLARYTVENVENSGEVVGRLNAFNTIGSILGTFLPTFVTIPAVGTAVTFLIFSGILLLLALVYFLTSGKKKNLCAIALLVFVACAFLGNSNSFAFWRNDLTYEGESIYNYLQVAEDDRSVRLSTNVLIGVQSVRMKSETLTGMYYDDALAAPVLAGYNEKESMDILVLGMGCGTFASQCQTYYPNARVEGVEIDEKITEVARTYFDLAPEVKVTTYDGRAYLQGTDAFYDVIMVDAYQDITIPFQMSTIEFFQQVEQHLKEDGVMVVNLNMRSDQPGNINEYLTDTIAAVFPHIYTVDVPYSENRELFAFRNESQVDRMLDTQGLATDLQQQLASVLEHWKQVEAGTLLLTDDKAPVEVLGMRVIDTMIQEELAYYQQLIREEGWQALLNAL